MRPSHARLVQRSATRPRRDGGRSSHGQSVRRSRHLVPQGRREAVARSIGPSQPPSGPAATAGGRRMVGLCGAAATRPSRGGGRPSHGRSVLRSRHTVPRRRREAVAGSVGPAQPLHGPVGPAGGRGTVGRSGAAMTRNAGAGVRSLHGRLVRRRRYPAAKGRRKAAARSVVEAQSSPGPVGPARGLRTVGRSEAAATRTYRAGGRPSHTRSVRISRRSAA